MDINPAHRHPTRSIVPGCCGGRRHRTLEFGVLFCKVYKVLVRPVDLWLTLLAATCIEIYCYAIDLDEKSKLLLWCL